MRLFFAASIPFLIADGTSFALPTPKPTTPWPSPTTTRALKLRFLPPLTTFVTRLIDTTVSLISNCEASTFARLRFICAICLKLQTCFASSVGDRFHAAVIEEPVAIEHHALDALLHEPLGDGAADGLRAGDVAAALFLLQRALHLRVHRRGRRDRAPGHVVDHLHVHMRDAAEHRQARARVVALHALANAVLDAIAAIFLRLHPHYFAPVLPTFFFSTSPV